MGDFVVAAKAPVVQRAIAMLETVIFMMKNDERTLSKLRLSSVW